VTGFAWTDNRISDDEIRHVYAEHDSNLKACAHALHIGHEAMRWHIVRLRLDEPGGMAPPEDGEGAMSHAEFVALVRAMRAVPFLAWLKCRDA
jgi:hypothetical protein